MRKPIRFNFNFKVLKSMATHSGNWKYCPNVHCNKKQRCMGGSRGTSRKHDQPLCAVLKIDVEAEDSKKKQAQRVKELNEWYFGKPH